MLQLDARGDLDELVCDKLAGSILHASPERHARGDRRWSATHPAADPAAHGRRLHPRPLVLARRHDLPDPARRWPAPGTRTSSSRSPASPPSRSPRPASTGPSRPSCASPATCAGAGSTRPSARTRILIGELGAAMIRGYQGDGLADPTAVLATAKHFAGYSETQGGRDASEADISPRKLRSWFLPPFERAVAAGCRTFMLGYQSIDGVPGHRQPLAAQRRAQAGVGLHRHARHRLGQRRPDGLGAAGLRRLRRGRRRGRQRRQRPGHDDARGSSRPPRRRSAAACSTRRRSTTPSAGSCALKFELGLFENPRSPDPERQADGHRLAPSTPRSTSRWPAARWCCCATTARCR